MLSQRSTDPTSGPSRIRDVQHAADHLDVLFDTAAPRPPTGWTTDDGYVWTSTSASALDGARPHRAAPLLATLGRAEAEGQLYLDLEAEHLVTLVGEHETALGVCRSVLLELGTEPCDGVHVVRVGSALGDGAAHDWAAVADDVVSRVRQTHEVLTAERWPNPFVGRVEDPTNDALAPMLVVADGPPPAAVVEALLASERSTVAVVCVAGAEPQGTVVECSTGELHVPSLGLRCVAQTVEAHEAAAIASLMGAASEVDVEEPPPTPPALPLEEGAATTAGPEWDVLVRVLGDITVEGTQRPVSPKPTAVIAYLALHREVSTEQLEDACWSEPEVTEQRRRLRDLMSRCRSAIGAAHLPTAADGRYRAGPRLLIDVDLFTWHAERAVDLPPDEAAAELRRALALVRGRVFTYPGRAAASYTWIDVENLVNRWEVRIAGVAQQCADLYLDLGRAEDAVEVINRLAPALPLHSALTETLMRAHAAVGDLRAVRTVYASYVNAMADLDLETEQSVCAVFRTITQVGP